MFNLFKSKVEVKTKIVEVKKELRVLDAIGTATLITGEIIPFELEGKVYDNYLKPPTIKDGTNYYSKMIYEGAPLRIPKDEGYIYYPMSAIKSISATVKENKIMYTYKEEVPV